MDGKPAKKRVKQGETFRDTHAIQFGLSIASKHSLSGAVETVLCRFCKVFGRENPARLHDETSKPRKAISTMKYFTSFRPEQYRRHHETQHPNEWAKYVAASEDEKTVFFDGVTVPYVETVKAVFESEKAITFTIRASIIDKIIGNLLFHPDELEGQTRERALAVFRLQDTEGDKELVYKAEEKHPSRFKLCVRFMSRGASFRMAAGLMDDTKDETGIGRYGGCNELVAARYARIVCAVSLERLSRLMKCSWALSLAMDCATHQGHSYVDIRCRFSTAGKLHNYHLIALPLHKRHTAVNIFDIVKAFLDALLPAWRQQIIGVATDGAATMVGHIGGLVTLIEREAQKPLIKVWCGLHQLDLKMQVIFEQALEETFLARLYAVIGYLRRQQNLVTEMRTTCPKVSDTRWLAMYTVADWLCVHHFRVRDYISVSRAKCDPSLVWWIFLFALREIAKEANKVFVSLQGLSTLVQQQHDRFVGLVQKIASVTGAKGPLAPDQLAALDPEDHEQECLFSISQNDAVAFVEGLDLWVCEILPLIAFDHKKTLVTAVARLCVTACSNIHALTLVPPLAIPVSPKDLVNTPMPAFLALINTHRQQLEQQFGKDGIYKIGEEFKSLKEMYEDKKEFRDAIEEFDHRLATFDEMWSLSGSAERFPHLVHFCGGLASVFPNTATVESDFSVLGCAKNEKRASLTDLSLEGVLHCKQWRRLGVLADNS